MRDTLNAPEVNFNLQLSRLPSLSHTPQEHVSEKKKMGQNQCLNET